MNYDEFLLLSSPVIAVAWSPDGTRIAGITHSELVIWDAATFHPKVLSRDHDAFIWWSLAWPPDSTRIAAIDLNVFVWDAATGKTLLTLPNPATADVAWSPDGKCLATANYDGTVQVWDAQHGTLLATFQDQEKGLGARVVAWAPDSTQLASAGDTVVVRSWDGQNGSILLTYRGDGQFHIYSVAWSPDGRRIASAADETVQVWDAATSNDLFLYQGHKRGVAAVAWSPDGKYIASGSEDNTVQIWQPE